jgi:hypothetical protein
METVMSSLGGSEILFSAYNGNQNRHTRDAAKYTGLSSIRLPAPSRYDIPSQVF